MGDSIHNSDKRHPWYSWYKWLPPGKRTLRELKHQTFFLEQIVNSSRSMVSIINRDYVYEKVNKTFCINHDRVSDHIVGCHLKDIWGPDNFVNNIKGNLDKCFNGKVVFYQAFFETPVWGKRYYEVVMRPVEDNHKKVTHALTETFDITEIKLKQQAAIEIEWEFRNLESNLPIGFFRCDLNGRLLNVNRAFTRITGAENENDLIGHSVRESYSEPELFEIHLKTLLAENVTSLGHVILKKSDGQDIICRISAFVVRDGSGNPVYIDGAIEDFTREADLEKRLQQSHKLDTIGLLAGGIAHDFNTILTTIYGYSEMSLEGLDTSSEAYQNIKKIIQALGRARSLTSQILTFSRQVGQEKISVRVLDILQETLGFIKPSVPDSVILEDIINAPDIKIKADPTQLFRVFINLINNAMQAMEANGGRLTITLDSRKRADINTFIAGKKSDGEFASIKFADTGPGMEESVAGRIFEPFYTTRKHGKGNGLGLSVVYGIVSELEGDILVNSKINEGTSIDVIIPLDSDVTDRADTVEPRANLLLIPENDNEANIIAIALSNSGYSVVSCNPVNNWIEKAGIADLVIIFDKSPEMPANDLLFSLSETGVTTPVLMISDFDIWLASEKEVSSDIVKANLFKPVSLKEIVYSIDSLINKIS